jgi:hypothetical protein
LVSGDPVLISEAHCTCRYIQGWEKGEGQPETIFLHQDGSLEKKQENLDKALLLSYLGVHCA